MISFFTGELNIIDTIFGGVLQIVCVIGIFFLLGEFANWLTDFNGAMAIYREQKKAKKTDEDLHRK